MFLFLYQLKFFKKNLNFRNEEVDAETEQLLQEIELLSSRTLKETQEWAS